MTKRPQALCKMSSGHITGLIATPFQVTECKATVLLALTRAYGVNDGLTIRQLEDSTCKLWGSHECYDIGVSYILCQLLSGADGLADLINSHLSEGGL